MTKSEERRTKMLELAIELAAKTHDQGPSATNPGTVIDAASTFDKWVREGRQ